MGSPSCCGALLVLGTLLCGEGLGFPASALRILPTRSDGLAPGGGMGLHLVSKVEISPFSKSATRNETEQRNPEGHPDGLSELVPLSHSYCQVTEPKSGRRRRRASVQALDL